MISFLEHNIMSIISTLFGGGSFLAYIFERKKNNALTSQEISKSDQDKISTAEKTIDLVEKLRLTMERQFDDMDKEISQLREELKKYLDQCSICENNKIKRK